MACDQFHPQDRSLRSWRSVRSTVVSSCKQKKKYCIRQSGRPLSLQRIGREKKLDTECREAWNVRWNGRVRAWTSCTCSPVVVKIVHCIFTRGKLISILCSTFCVLVAFIGLWRNLRAKRFSSVDANVVGKSNRLLFQSIFLNRFFCLRRFYHCRFYHCCWYISDDDVKTTDHKTYLYDLFIAIDCPLRSIARSRTKVALDDRTEWTKRSFEQ